MSTAAGPGALGGQGMQPDGGLTLSVQYLHGDAEALLAEHGVLAVIGFAAAGEGSSVQVPLRPLDAPAPLEVWRVPGVVRRGRRDGVDYAEADGLQWFCVEVAERDRDLRSAACEAYACLRRFLAGSDHRYPLRIWNTIAAITDGEGDAERYRQFCIGRSEGMGPDWGPFPAATAVGSHGRARLQVYGLAAREPGLPVENPRQVSAWRYPRQYGPQPPSFARAMLAGDPRLPLLLSGTASVVGHASAHAGDVLAQLAETCANLERLLASAREARPGLPPRFGAGSTLKVYLRDPAQAAQVRAQLVQRFPGAGLLLLEAEVCRRELLLEIDGFHGP